MGCQGSKAIRVSPAEVVDPSNKKSPAQNVVVQIGYQNENGTGVSPTEAKLSDARQLKSPPTLGLNGFQLVKFEHGVTDFSSEAQASGETEKQIKERLYPKLEQQLLDTCVGATRVIVFNHGLRASSVPQSAPHAASNPASGVKAPVKEAHSDFSESISPLVARSLVPDIDTQTQRYALKSLDVSGQAESCFEDAAWFSRCPEC
jgi:hypothetical protein